MSTHSQSNPALAISSAVWVLANDSQPPMVCSPLRHLASAAFFLTRGLRLIGGEPRNETANRRGVNPFSPAARRRKARA